eukprot:2480300-Karenia_brevis.AAC.1
MTLVSRMRMQCIRFGFGRIPGILLHIWHCTKVAAVHHSAMGQRAGDLSMVNGNVKLHVSQYTCTGRAKQMQMENLLLHGLI